MAKKSKATNRPLINELNDHYIKGTQDNDQRRTRENGWNDVLESYLGILPRNWPYLSEIVNPIPRRIILEKNARLFNGKLKGRLAPREGGDLIKAKINNAILDFQWDNASEGGSMLEKWALMDIQARLFGASFALTYWNTDDGFEGNEMKVLDNRDIWVDYTVGHIKSANWVDVREWLGVDYIMSRDDIYDLGELKALSFKESGGDRRDTYYESVIKTIKGLEDRVGTDIAFPTVEVVTEYRRDRWITWLPNLNVVIRDIENPYKHKRIPVVQLRYYGVGDDVYGDSEVEPILPLWRADCSLFSGTVDTINLRQRPPIKVANNSTVRTDTLEYGPSAVWFVGDSVNNVMEVQTGSEIVNNFQVIHGAILQAIESAMGETSQGVSTVTPFNPEKTATEIKPSEKQKLSRDQQNQIYLEQALKDQMMLWQRNNQQFMFDDPTRKIITLRIVGKEMIKDLQESGLDSESMDEEVLTALKEMIDESGGEVSDGMLDRVARSVKTYKHSVITNPEEMDPENFQVKPKLEVEGDTGSLHILPEDLDGMYDYIPVVTSMAVNAADMQREGRDQALQLLLSPTVQQQLQLEGEKLKVKELLVQTLEDKGVTDADKFFESIQQQPNLTGAGGIPQGPQDLTNDPNGGMAGYPTGAPDGGEAILS